MKNKSVLVLIALILSIGCQSEKKQEKDKITIGTKKQEKSAEFIYGEKIFKGKGNCYSCHRVDKKTIGPSVIEIMKIYNEQNGDIIGFLRQKKDPIVDPDNYAVMKTNFARIKKFTDEELKAVKLYMTEVVNN